jgi:pyruvate formate lyase activating enzyme
MTDRKENIAGIARLLLKEGEDAVERWELCAFNNLCRDKYRRLGSPWALEELPLMQEEAMEALRSAALEAGFPEEKLFWTGMVRKGEK